VINPYLGCTHGCLYCYAVFMRKYSRCHTHARWGDFCGVQSKYRRAPAKGAESQKEPGVCHAFQRLRPLPAGRATMAAHEGCSRSCVISSGRWKSSHDRRWSRGTWTSSRHAAGLRGVFHRHENEKVRSVWSPVHRHSQPGEGLRRIAPCPASQPGCSSPDAADGPRRLFEMVRLMRTMS